MIEKKLYQMGFEKLQEKESMIYYEKNDEKEQIYIIFDKKNKKIKSMDSYEIRDGQMNVSEPNRRVKKAFQAYI